MKHRKIDLLDSDGVRNLHLDDQFTVIVRHVGTAYLADVLHHGSWIGVVTDPDGVELLIKVGMKVAAHRLARRSDACGPGICRDAE